MDYEFKYRLQSAPAGRLDGSGCLDHDIFAVSQPVGDGGFVPVPGRHKTISVPASEITVVMDMPDATGPERQAKNAAYKDALASNLNTQPVALSGWTAAQLEEVMDANDLAAYEAGRVNEYITVTLGLTYPVDFSI